MLDREKVVGDADEAGITIVAEEVTHNWRNQRADD
jgi:hypothetical protein